MTYDYLNLSHQTKIMKQEYNRIVRLAIIVSFILGMIFGSWLNGFLYGS